MRRGLSPADVHKAIRIRERYLTALEEESWEMLPGEAYTKGFLRTYAEHLSLNSQLYIDEYNARVARHDEEPTLVPHASATTPRHLQRTVLVALVSILVVGAAVAGLAAWRLGGTSKPPEAQQPSGAGSVAAPAVTVHRTVSPLNPPPSPSSTRTRSGAGSAALTMLVCKSPDFLTSVAAGASVAAPARAPRKLRCTLTGQA